MPSDAGMRQEQQLFDYLRFSQGCVEVIEGDQKVRSFLGMSGLPKCADALGFHQSLNATGPRRITVAESKGKDIDSAMEQLGNAAAGVFEKFGRETRVDLLLMVPGLQELPIGLQSPGPGYCAVPLATGLNKFALLESMGGSPMQARPKVTYLDWTKWWPQVALLNIVVIVLRSSKT